MPKEYVPERGTDVCGFRVRIGWERNGFVQIATVDPKSEEVVTGPITREYGLYVTLDRVDINKLIRDLRRARDQAFGHDE